MLSNITLTPYINSNLDQDIARVKSLILSQMKDLPIYPIPN